MHSPTIHLRTLRPVRSPRAVAGLTTKGRFAVQLIRLERAFEQLDEPTQQAVVDELQPLVRAIGSRAALQARTSGKGA